MNRCLKCGAAPTPDTADTDLPMCYAHRLDGESESGQPRDADAFADYLTEADEERLTNDLAKRELSEVERRCLEDDNANADAVRGGAFGDLGL